MKVYYIIPLNNRLTGHPDHVKVNILYYYFQERYKVFDTTTES